MTLTPQRLPWFITTGILICLFLQAVQVFVLPVHVDEFRFLADVHLALERQLASPLMNFHVHFFAWIGRTFEGELQQINAARALVLALECGTATLIFATARSHFHRSASLLAVLCYLSFSFVMHHGASFRFDTPGGFVLMCAVAWLVRGRQGGPAGLAALPLFALACLITLKSAIFLPVIGLLAWNRWRAASDQRAEAQRMVIGAAVGALGALVLLQWHAGFVLQAPLETARAVASEGVFKTVIDAGLFPRWKDLVRSLIDNPVQWFAICWGWASLLRCGWPVKVGDGTQRSVAVLVLLLPLASIAFYRNAYPYFYVFMMTTVVIGAAAFFQNAKPSTGYLMTALMVVSAGIHVFVFSLASPMRTTQSQVLAGIHQLFPQTVPYIDCCSMLPTFKQKGFFMSSWGGEEYDKRQRPVLSEAIEKGAPVFVFANHPRLLQAFQPRRFKQPAMLVGQDADTLQSNYLPYWGLLYIAGKSLRADPDIRPFDILIPGTYQLTGQWAATIDGTVYQPGERVDLGKGSHTLASQQTTHVTLRWFNEGRVPVDPWPPGPLIPNL